LVDGLGGLVSDLVFALDHCFHARRELIDRLNAGALFRKHISTNLTAFLLLEQIVELAALRAAVSDLEEGLSTLFRSNDAGVVHVDLVNSVVHLGAIKISIDMLAEILVAHLVALFVLTDHVVQTAVNFYFGLRKALFELVDSRLSSCIVTNSVRDLVLVNIQCGVHLRRLVRAASVELDINRLDVGLNFLSIAILDSERLLHLRELGVVLGLFDVGNKFGRGGNSHLILNFVQHFLSGDRSLVELGVNLVELL